MESLNVCKQPWATLTVFSDLMNPAAAKPQRIEPGTRVAELYPGGRNTYICRLDGEWLLRGGWGHQLQPGQRVEFFAYPHGGDSGGGGSDAGRVVLTIVALYAAVQFGQWQYAINVFGSQAAATAVAQVALMALVNVLVPVDTGNVANAGTQSTTYNAALAGNQARLDQTIPCLYGRNKTYPDFGAQPYSVMDENDDQIWHGLYCIGHGKYVKESVTIDDTDVRNFQQAEVRWLNPGEAPTLVNPAMVTAVEVAGLELQDGRYAGPFIGVRAQTEVSVIHIDMTFPRGIAQYDASGNPNPYTVGWLVEFRAVDDFGVQVTPWEVLDSPTLNMAQTSQVRRSYTYTLPPPVGYTGPLPYRCRPQVRLTRTTPFDDNNRVSNTIRWDGFRCEIYGGAPLCPTATYVEFRIRADEQMQGMAQRRVGVISRRMLRTWDVGTQSWGPEVETRLAAWALADKWTNTAYGDGYADDECDLDGLAALAEKSAARQDRFDAVFDQSYESAQADQMILQGCRAVAFRRNGKMTVSRDEQKNFPVTAFTARNIDEGSVSIRYAFSTEQTADGVIIEYWDNRIWDWRDIVCPAPGVTTPERAQRLKLFGVTGRIHAEREGRYQAANNFYRRKYPTFRTELEGMIPAFGSAVVFAPNLKGFGRSGDIVSFDELTLEVLCSEPLQWVSGASHYLTIMDRNGEVRTSYLVSRGSTDYHAVLPSVPSFDVSTEEAYEERSKYVFGVNAPFETTMRVISLRNSASESPRRVFEIAGVIEDARVHAADSSLLPVDGEVQDPVDNAGDDGSGSGTALIPYLTDQTLATFGGVGGLAYTGLRLSNNGIAYELTATETGTALPIQLGLGEWLLRGPYSPAQAAEFEVRYQFLSGTAGAGWPPSNTWLSLGTDREWSVTVSGFSGNVYAELLLEIRRVSDSRLMETATVRLEAFTGDSA